MWNCRRSWPIPRRRTEGHTLVEVLVAAGIMLLVLLCTCHMLVSSLSFYAVERTATELQQGALGPLARLSRELAEADPYAVRVDTSPAGIVFASPRDSQGRFTFDASTNLMWQRYICYYVTTVNGSQALVRKEMALSAPRNTPPPLVYSTSSFQSLNAPLVAVGWNVVAFSVSGFNPVQVSLTTNQSALGRLDQLQFVTRVCLRN